MAIETGPAERVFSAVEERASGEPSASFVPHATFWPVGPERRELDYSEAAADGARRTIAARGQVM